MEFEEFLSNVGNVAKVTSNMEFKRSISWGFFYRPEYMSPLCRYPFKVVSLGDAQEPVVRIPDYIVDSYGDAGIVNDFENNIFAGKEYITDIVLSSNSISWLCEGAFKDCKNLKRIAIPKRIGKIYKGAFECCDSLEDVYFEGTEEEWHEIDIVHKGIRVANPNKLGLYCDIEDYAIPGNEALFRAKIHYNCSWKIPTPENELFPKLILSHDFICINVHLSILRRPIDESNFEYSKRYNAFYNSFKGIGERKFASKVNNFGYIAFQPQGYYKQIDDITNDFETPRIVVNVNDDPNFLENMLSIAKECAQESILYIKAGSNQGEWWKRDVAEDNSQYKIADCGEIFIGKKGEAQSTNHCGYIFTDNLHAAMYNERFYR